jgi:hypothetical protein
MSSYYHYNAHQHPAGQHNAGRSRRAARISTSQNSQKQFRGVRSMKELTDSAAIVSFRQKFEAGRSFDLDDDMEFCPALLTESDLQSIHSASDRSSLSSGSPESSPTQHTQQVTPSFSLNSASNPYLPAGYQPTNLKVHQPAPSRARNAIPIVNPNARMASPPNSVSPGRLQQQQQRQPMNRGW